MLEITQILNKYEYKNNFPILKQTKFDKSLEVNLFVVKFDSQIGK